MAAASVEDKRPRKGKGGKGQKTRPKESQEFEESTPSPSDSPWAPLPPVAPGALGAPAAPVAPVAHVAPVAPVAPAALAQDAVPQREFRTEPGACAMKERRKQQQHFDTVHKTNAWGSDMRVTTSGKGSDQKGAFDWVQNINLFMLQYNVKTVADLPSGDVAWQFSVPSINTAKAYFGGDISASVAQRNGQRYTAHLNKVFRHWDLIECGVPQVCPKSSPCGPFDMVITRDALQHMTVFDGLRAVRQVVNSGAKFFAVSSYLPETVDRLARSYSYRSPEEYIQQCQTRDELRRKFCRPGFRTEDSGWWYPNVMRCFPFNFPPPILDKPSHETFRIEPDNLQIYRVDDLKQAVASYDEFAEFCRRA